MKDKDQNHANWISRIELPPNVSCALSGCKGRIGFEYENLNIASACVDRVFDLALTDRVASSRHLYTCTYHMLHLGIRICQSAPVCLFSRGRA